MRTISIVSHSSLHTPHAEMLAWALEQSGWTVKMWNRGGSGVVRETLGGRWSFRTIAEGGLRFEAATMRALWEAERSGADVVCIHGAGLAYRAAIVRLLPVARKPLVYFNPDFCAPGRYWWRSALEGRLARQAVLHMNHEYHRAYFVREHHRLNCPVLVVPPSLPKRWPIPEPDEKTRAALVGDSGTDAILLRLHGGYHPLRRVEETFEAMSVMPRTVRLVMTDPGREANLIGELLQKFKLRGRVVFLPRLPFNEMLRYTVNCDIGLLLYRNNDYGNYFQAPGRLTEYLACGLPVLASRFTGLQMLVEGRGLGFCVDGGRPEEIARGVEQFRLARRQGRLPPEYIRRRFEEDFAYDHWVGRIAKAFEEAASGVSCCRELPLPWWPWLSSEEDDLMAFEEGDSR